MSAAELARSIALALDGHYDDDLGPEGSFLSAHLDYAAEALVTVQDAGRGDRKVYRVTVEEAA